MVAKVHTEVPHMIVGEKEECNSLYKMYATINVMH